MKILLAIDGSPCSRKILTYVASNEVWFRPDFSYILLYVVGTAAGVDEAVREARPALDDASLFLNSQLGIEPVRAVRVGKPAIAIADYAHRNQCNLVVMGSHGHGSLSALVLGSVTQGVLAACQVPVLVIR